MSDDKIGDALKLLPYGFYAIGSRNGGEVNILVANWLTQASFGPRQVAFALSKTAHSHQLVSAGKVFSVNIFRKEDQDIIKGFTKSLAKNPDKVKDAHFQPGVETGCPIIEGAAAYLECKVVGIYDSGGDHEVVVGEVVGAGVNKEGAAADSLTLQDIGWSYAG
jgi:flavin reductase (DIM6/NTAB) family NADH-FMN oxidoreductase RutF